MKHLWTFHHYAQKPSTGKMTRHFSLAKNLVRHGWIETVFVAGTEHHSGKQFLVDGEKRRIEESSGVRFIYLKTPTYKGNGFDRILNMAAYSVRAILPSYTRDLPPPDVIIGSNPHPLAALAGAVLARRHKAPYVFEARDLWTQYAIDTGKIKPGGVPARLIHALDKRLYDESRKIIILTPKAADYLIPRGVDPEKIVWIPNGVDLEMWPFPSPPLPKESFTLMYFGAHAQLNGLAELIESMAILNRRSLPRPVRLRLIGDGTQKPYLIQRVKELGLSNVSFEDLVPNARIPEIASQADAFITILIDLPNAFKYGVSMNKLFDYMAAGRPIIFAVNAGNDPVQEAGCGITIEPENRFAIADGIEQLMRTSDGERDAMGRRARDYVEKHHDHEMLSANLAQMLNEIIQ